MGEPQSGPPARPRPRPLKVIGVLNVVLGAALVALAWSSLAGMAFNAMTEEPMAALDRALHIRADWNHRELLDRLDRLEREAQSDQAQAMYREERSRREEAGPQLPPGAELVMIGGNMQSFGTWTIVNAATSLGLNLLLILAGAGLVQRVEWGRRLAVGVAWLKLARLLVLQSVFVAFVVPAFARQLGEAVTSSIAAQGAAMPATMPNMTQLYAVIYTAWGLTVLVLGSIYPIVMLVVLNRPGVVAASLPAPVRAAEMMRERDRGR